MTAQNAWHATGDQSIARRSTLADLVRRSAAREPGKLALVFGGVRQTFAELDVTVSRAANALAERGVRYGDRVLLLAHNSHGFVVAYFALARLGAVSVPVNFMLGPDEIAYVLTHSGAVAVIAEDALADTADRACQVAGIVPAVKVAIGSGATETPGGWLDFETAYRYAPTDEPDAPVTDDDPVQKVVIVPALPKNPSGKVLKRELREIHAASS